MFCNRMRVSVRILVVGLVLFAMIFMAGCSQESGKTESREDALKSLSTLSDEDKAVEKMNPGEVESKEAASREQQEPGTAEADK